MQCMMLILRDDLILETFESPDQPPTWIEWIDIENEEYEFCSDRGHRYIGKVRGDGGLGEWTLVPAGTPDLENAVSLVHRAVGIERSQFSDLASLLAYITSGPDPGRESGG